MHMITLHTNGSSNPLGVSSNSDKLPMHPYFLFKDLVTVLAFFGALALIVLYAPNLLGHSDNYIPANPISTPSSIVPEWLYKVPFSTMPTTETAAIAFQHRYYNSDQRLHHTHIAIVSPNTTNTSFYSLHRLSYLLQRSVLRANNGPNINLQNINKVYLSASCLVMHGLHYGV